MPSSGAYLHARMHYRSYPNGQFLEFASTNHIFAVCRVKEFMPEGLACQNLSSELRNLEDGAASFPFI